MNLNQNKMEKEFVPYELALRMKHLGFNEPCFGFYNNAEVIPYIKHELNDELREIYKGDFKAPTFSQAFRWFRDNHDLRSWIESIQKSNHRAIIVNYYNVMFNTYGEAELACLEKLLEIIESKSE